MSPEQVSRAGSTSQTSISEAAEPSKCEIRPATEVPASSLYSHFDRMFPERAGFLKNHWQWLYRVGECNWSPAPLVAVSAGQVIGFIANIPMVLRKGDEEHQAAWLVDLAILPEVQRRGTGMALIRASMDQCPILLGFGNEKSVGAVLKCGWRLRQDTLSLQLLLHPESHPKYRDSVNGGLVKAAGAATRAIWQARTMLQREVSIEPISAENLAEFAARDFGSSLHVARSVPFLDWRVARSPHAAEHVLLRYPKGTGGRNNAAECTAIARIGEDQGFRRLHILSLAAPPDKTLISDFLAGVIRWAAREDFHRVLLVSTDAMVIGVAKWWLPIATKLRFIYHAKDPAGWQLLQTAGQNWECLDNDFDLT